MSQGPGRVRVGTSGWNYPEWRGSFYPADTRPAGMLDFYARRFDVVEVNASFYRMPTPSTVERWAQAVPPSFSFVLKAPQRITHFARLRNVDETLRLFCDTARLLGPRLGAVLFQLPPSFARDLDRLGDALVLLPPDLRAAFEFRHPSWFTEEVYARLATRNAALCIAEDEDGTTPALATADWGYLRLRAVDYTDARLAEWVDTLHDIGRGWREAFVFFKHEERGTGPALARRLLERLGEGPAG